MVKAHLSSNFAGSLLRFRRWKSAQIMTPMAAARTTVFNTMCKCLLMVAGAKLVLPDSGRKEILQP